MGKNPWFDSDDNKNTKSGTISIVFHTFMNNVKTSIFSDKFFIDTWCGIFVIYHNILAYLFSCLKNYNKSFVQSKQSENIFYYPHIQVTGNTNVNFVKMNRS